MSNWDLMMPAKSGTVLMVLNINPAVPNANDIESMTKTVAFALLLVDTPPCNIPAAKKIRNMVSGVACMPPSEGAYEQLGFNDEWV